MPDCFVDSHIASDFSFPSIRQHILAHFMPSFSPDFLQSRSSTQYSSLDFFGYHSLLDLLFTTDGFIPASLAAMIVYVLCAGAKERTAMPPSLFLHDLLLSSHIKCPLQLVTSTFLSPRKDIPWIFNRACLSVHLTFLIRHMIC